ncbi:MAG: ABC transporter substrate-binding protein [Desulfobacteraceae bacterium]|nr:ABC transporter substrate-binding protein [Desulfobacteraceae bacterium]
MKTGFLLKSLFVFVLASFMVLPVTKAMSDNIKHNDPMALVNTTVNSILDLLKNKEMNKDQRRAKIRALVFERFDFNEMSKRVLGTNWRQLTPAQQKTFADIFSKLLEASYVGKVENYTNEKVVFKTEQIQDDYAKVNTVIHTKTNDIPLVYFMYFNGKDWYVYDVIIENVSLVSTYRSTYNQIIKQKGFDELIKEMNRKIKELSAPKNGNNAS